MLHTQIAYFKNATNKVAIKKITIQQIIDLCKSIELKQATNHLRNELIPTLNNALNYFETYVNTDIDTWNYYTELRKTIEKYKVKNEDVPQDLQAQKKTYTNTEFIQVAEEREFIKNKRKEEVAVFKTSQFPAVTFSTEVFKDDKRLKDNADIHTGLLCIDVDKLSNNDLASLTTDLQKDANVLLYFISPSGNGVKIIFLIPPYVQQHTKSFEAIEFYFKQHYNICIDTSGKDVSRLCFLCHDSNVYVNDNATLFDVEKYYNLLTASKATDNVTNGGKLYIDGSQNVQQQKPNAATTNSIGVKLTIEDVEKFTNNKFSLVPGKRNEWIYYFAINCKRNQFTQDEAKNYAMWLCPDKNETEIKATVNSAFTLNKKANDTYIPYQYNYSTNDTKQTNKTNNSQQPNTPNTVQNNNHNKEVAEDIQFWYVIEKTDKSTGEAVEKYCVDYVKYLEFLNSKGFYRLPQGDAYEYVFTKNKSVEIIKPSVIIDFVREYIIDKGERKVLAMLIQGNKSYLAVDKFQFIEKKTFDFYKDSIDATRLFFKNGIAEITKDGVQLKPYKGFEKYIWAKQMVDHDFVVNDYDYMTNENFVDVDKWNSQFSQFIWHASCNAAHEKDFVQDVEILKKRFLSFCTGIGYLVDGYKHLSVRKAVVGVDRQIADSTMEKNGRTGKSIYGKALEFLKVVDNIDGKNYDPKYQFRYEAITPATQVICFNDMMKNHDIEMEFTIVADDYSVNKRNTGLIKYNYTNSAKVYINTNYAPRGEGSSYRGRMHVIEFGDFFNDSNSPYNHFGNFLFTDWDEVQWNYFFNFMAWCVKMYKQIGLIDYPDGNLSKRKLLGMIDQEFFDYLEDYTGPTENKQYSNLQINGYTNKTTLYNGWYTICIANEQKKPSAKWLLNVITHYCKQQGYCFYIKKAGGVEEFWIGNKAPYDVILLSVKPRIAAANESRLEQTQIFN